MTLDELRIRADEARMLISSVELRLDFLDHFPVVKKLYSEAMSIVVARLNFYEKLISEREGKKT